MKLFKLLIVVGICLCLTGCADTISIEHSHSLVGFWHGMIIVFSFIGSLFSDDIAVYAVYNNGAFYNLGFIIGACGISSASVSVGD